MAGRSSRYSGNEAANSVVERRSSVPGTNTPVAIAITAISAINGGDGVTQVTDEMLGAGPPRANVHSPEGIFMGAR